MKVSILNRVVGLLSLLVLLLCCTRGVNADTAVFDFNSGIGSDFSVFNGSGSGLAFAQPSGLFNVATGGPAIRIFKTADDGTTVPTGLVGAGIRSNFKVLGNFSITVDFTLTDFPLPNQSEGLNESWLSVVSLDYQSDVSILRYSHPLIDNLIEGWTNPSARYIGDAHSGLMRGQYKLQRSGSLITEWYSDFGSSSFTFLGSIDGFSDPMRIQLFGAQSSNRVGYPRSATSLDICYDNLIVVADQIQAVPEPSTFVLLGMGIVGLIGWTWLRRQTSRGGVWRNAAIGMIAAFLVIVNIQKSQSAESPPPVKWIKQVGTSSRDTLSAMTLDGADNLYVTGYTFGNWDATNAGYSDAIIAKYDRNGNECWAKQFGSGSFDSGGGIAWNGANDLYFAGDWQQWNYHLSKCSIDGNLLWTKQPILSSSQKNSIQSVKIAKDGSVYVCGDYGPLIKHNQEGAVLWTSPIYGGRDMVLDRSNNIFMTCYSEKSGMFLNKVSSSGTVLWTKTIGKNQTGDAIAISPKEDALYVAGCTGNASISKYDMLGNLLWTRTFVGKDGIDYAKSKDLAVDATGNVYVTGYTYGNLAATNPGYQDIFLRKYDPNGNDLWTWQYGTTGDDVGMAVAIGNQGNIYLTASINPSSDSGNGLIIAFVPEPSTFVLLGMGAFGLFVWSWRKLLKR